MRRRRGRPLVIVLQPPTMGQLARRRRGARHHAKGHVRRWYHSHARTACASQRSRRRQTTAICGETKGRPVVERSRARGEGSGAVRQATVSGTGHKGSCGEAARRGPITLLRRREECGCVGELRSMAVAVSSHTITTSVCEAAQHRNSSQLQRRQAFGHSWHSRFMCPSPPRDYPGQHANSRARHMHERPDRAVAIGFYWFAAWCPLHVVCCMSSVVCRTYLIEPSPLVSIDLSIDSDPCRCIIRWKCVSPSSSPRPSSNRTMS